MTDHGDSTLNEADWSWVRWQRIRWDFVDALMRATHTPTIPWWNCKTERCCGDLKSIVPQVGMELAGGHTGWPKLQFSDGLESLITSRMRDGMIMLDALFAMQGFARANPLSGMMEVPEAVGPIIWSEHFVDLQQLHDSSDAVDPMLLREFVYALVTLALPDEFLANFVPLVRGRQAYREFTEKMNESNLAMPDLPDVVIERLQENNYGYATPPFGDEWDEVAPYGLEFARDDKMSLSEYWDFWPSVEHIFGFAARGNEAGTGVGLIARNSQNLFVSQQIWIAEKGESEWNACTYAFNAHLAPHIARGSEGSPAIVVFSTYRHSAYIASPEPDSWDEYAPASAVLGPLPHGWGIVGVWDNYDEARYTPRSLDSIIKADHSEAITASARYLQECLLATRGG